MYRLSAVDPGPFFYRPDPKKPIYAAARPERLVRRGPRHYVMVGRMPDGTRVEARLTRGSFHMEGLF